jgi:predicted amidophosphoribosyltransferase
MIRICPSCRAPSNRFEPQCWVCQRVFDGSEALIGEVPYARRPRRSQHDGVDKSYAEGDPFEHVPWRSAG